MHWYQWLPTIYWLVAIVAGLVAIVCNARRFMRSIRWLRKAGGGFLKERVARLKERVKRRRSFSSPTKEM